MGVAINMQGIRVPLTKTNRLLFVSIVSLLEEKYFASIIVIVSFAISDGWIVIGPIDIQR
jgi:hypothetical protein